MKRILLSLIVLTNIFSFNVLAAASEYGDPKTAEVHLVMYATSREHTPGQETLITMTGNPGPCDITGPFKTLDDLKEFVAQRLYSFDHEARESISILSFTALSADESDNARVGINPDSALIRRIMSDDGMVAQMALLNAALISEGRGAMRVQIQL